MRYGTRQSATARQAVARAGLGAQLSSASAETGELPGQVQPLNAAVLIVVIPYSKRVVSDHR